MKRFFLFLFASVLSISMFAVGETGNTKGDAIPYDWADGILVTSQPNVGKWYVVNLDKTHGGLFYDKEYVEAHGMDPKMIGKTAEGNTEANIKVVNPLGQKVEVDITAYIAANEYSHHYTLQANEAKALNVGTGMLVKMGNYKVYLYLVMDVEITQEQAEQMPAVEVKIEEAPANSTAFVPVPFDWTGFGPLTPAAGNIIPANTEVWLAIDWNNNIDAGYTFKVHAETTNGAATTIHAGLATDCPATSIQEQNTNLAANEKINKAVDPAMLDMVPSTIYVRLQADQPLHVWASEVDEDEVLPSEPIFYTDGAVKIEKNQTYQLSAESKYFVEYETLIAPEYYYMQVELTNNSDEEVTLHGKAAKVAGAKNANIGVKSAMSHDVTIGAHKTLKKEIDNTIMSNLTTTDSVYGYITGGNSNISFQLVQVCTEKDPCNPVTATPITISAEEIAQTTQPANTTKWYAVNIADAKTAKADVRINLNASEEVHFDVDIASDCALGEPTQSYSGTSASASYTLNYALYEKASNILYVRVKTNKEITVTGEMLTSIKWNGTNWVGGTPDLTKSARIEGNLTIHDGETVRALGLTMTEKETSDPTYDVNPYYTITIENGGKLIIGKEGIKGSETVNQIVIEEGGNLMIDPEAEQNYKPFITAYKALDLSEAQDGSVHAGGYKHEFIALPVDNRENTPVGLYYSNWTYNVGWGAVDGFRNAFVGYDVTKSSANPYCGYFAGQLAPTKNQVLSMPGQGWHAFGNSWLVSLDVVADIIPYVGSADQAVYVYAHNPITIGDVDYSTENGENTKQYIPVTSAIISQVPTLAQVKPMEGFFLYTEGATTANLYYNGLYNTHKAQAKRAAENTNNMVAAVLRGGNASDFVYMIEGEDAIAHKMESNGLAIYAEEGLAQVANTNLIGTTLTIQTNDATEYTLHFTWLKGETMYLKDLVNGNIIAMTAENQYTFNAEPNSVSERFQIVGRNNVVTGMENSAVLEGANKRIENGKVVIIKNGVKYDVLGAQL